MKLFINGYFKGQKDPKKYPRERLIFVPGDLYDDAFEAILGQDAIFVLDEDIIELLYQTFSLDSLYVGSERQMLATAAMFYAPKIRNTWLEMTFERAIAMIVETGLYDNYSKRRMILGDDSRRIRKIISQYESRGGSDSP